MNDMKQTENRKKLSNYGEQIMKVKIKNCNKNSVILERDI